MGLGRQNITYIFCVKLKDKKKLANLRKVHKKIFVVKIFSLSRQIMSELIQLSGIKPAQCVGFLKCHI